MTIQQNTSPGSSSGREHTHGRAPGAGSGTPGYAATPGGDPPTGRLPLAVAVADADGRVTHWSRGAVQLFGWSHAHAVGAELSELLPVLGGLERQEPTFPGERESAASAAESAVLAPAPRSGWARIPGSHSGGHSGGHTGGQEPGAGAGHAASEVLWWAYPLPTIWRERTLVLATDAARVGGGPRRTGPEQREIAPGFLSLEQLPEVAELSRGFAEMMPRMGPRAAERIVAWALSLGYPVLEYSLRRAMPVTPYWGEPVRAVHPGADPRGRGSAVAGVPGDRPELPSHADDLDYLEHAAVRERLEFLNETSARIGSSLDLARTIREVTEAAVPRFADFAGTHLREQMLAGEGFPDGPPDTATVMHRVWVTHSDEPGRWDDTVPVGETFAFPEHTPFYQCMATGEPVLIRTISEELGNRIAGEFEKRDLRPLINGRSLLIVPLKARRVVLGFIVLLRRADREPFDEMDRTTAAELAARAGLVLDNARLYTYQETAAETLQDSMLPKDLPQPAGVSAAYRYLPGTLLGKVGGDWFDTVPLPGSRVALVVGDVMGHGINSAAMMGQLRIAVQTLASLDLPPDQVLRRLDDLALRLGENYLATCLYAVYDPIGRELRLANAGHIPPVLQLPDGEARLLDLPSGAPIGVGGVPFETVAVPVPDGSRLLLCTDGLVEVRGEDIGLGLAALTENLARPGVSLEHSCDALIRALNAVGRKDDVALLMARLDGIPPESVAEWSFTPDPAEVRRARVLVRSTLLEWGLDAPRDDGRPSQNVDSAVLVVDELVANAVRHAAERTAVVRLRLVRADALVVEVSDDDPALPVLLPFLPGADGGAGAEIPERGRGLQVVTRLAARWGATRGREGNAGGKTVWCELPVH
jgi:serine phosphatase RsbU (regulator of sigma subunit)/anti-sigma regulatory factor (Ser/Thr protein kinase)